MYCPALIYQVIQGYIRRFFSYMCCDQILEYYFTNLKALFRWIRIQIFHISILALTPLPPPNHISKISISGLTPHPPITCLYNTCTLPNIMMKNRLIKMFYDDLSKHYLLFLIISMSYLFGSSILPVWFRKRAARAANNSHVFLLFDNMVPLKHLLLLLDTTATLIIYRSLKIEIG